MFDRIGNMRIKKFKRSQDNKIKIRPAEWQKFIEI